MSDCNRLVCGECLPLFRYFVNQQEALINAQVTITPECPVGYDCNTPVPYTIYPGEKTIIPDIPPNDPDNDPECDYDCEVNTHRNRYTGLQPRAEVWNEEQTATCSDLGYTAGLTASVTVPKNTIKKSYDPETEIRSVIQAQANIEAFEMAKGLLQQNIDNGLAECEIVDTPDDLTEPDSTIIGNFNPFPVSSGDPLAYTEATTEGGVYSLEYISGAAQWAGNPCPNCYPPFCIPAVYTWKWNSSSYLLAVNDRATETDIGSFELFCDTIESNVETAAQAAGMSPATGTHDGLGKKVEVHGPEVIPPDDYDFQSTVSVRLTRTRKWIYPEPERVRINPAQFASTVHDGLIPGPGAVATGLDTWTGDYPGTSNYQFGDPQFNIFGASGTSIRGYSLSITMNVQYNNSLPVAVSPTTQAGWIAYVADAGGAMWVGVKTTGYTPVGTYRFEPNIPGFTVQSQYADVRVVQNTALDPNARVGNVLTAISNGPIPSVDGVNLVLNDRVLVTNEPLGANNGIYYVTDVGSAATPWQMTRAVDMDVAGECFPGIWVKVTEGTVYTDTYWQLINFPGPLTLNTTPLTFQPILNNVEIESY